MALRIFGAFVTVSLALTACGSGGGENGAGGTGGDDDGTSAGADSGAESGAGGHADSGIGGGQRDGGSGSTANDGSAAESGCAPVAAAPPDTTVCGSSNTLTLPDDPSARGPWAVGARTITVAGLRTEVWYPAKHGSESCVAKVQYDIREHLPTADQTKIPDADNPLQDCDCYRDLPIDDAHGPYPVISFIHGTAAFRTQSLTFTTHWASRGFVVVASDHPHIELKDILTFNVVGTDQQGDAIKVLAALDSPAGDLAFLAGHLDMTRIGASGHSAGGGAVGNPSISLKRSGIKVVIPMAAGGVTAGGDLASALVMSAADDGIAMPSSQVNGYTNDTKPRKRFVQIDRSGHLVFSDLCSIGASEGGILAVAQKYNVTNASLLATLGTDGCVAKSNYTPLTPEQGWDIVDYASSAAFEETLLCNAGMAAKLSAITTQYTPLIASYQEQLQ